MIFPLIALGASYIFPFEEYVRQTIFILACCPVASVVLNFAELLGEGQEEGANMVLLGTMMCIITMPVMLLIL